MPKNSCNLVLGNFISAYVSSTYTADSPYTYKPLKKCYTPHMQYGEKTIHTSLHHEIISAGSPTPPTSAIPHCLPLRRTDADAPIPPRPRAVLWDGRKAKHQRSKSEARAKEERRHLGAIRTINRGG